MKPWGRGVRYVSRPQPFRMQSPIVVAAELWTALLVIWVVGMFTVKRVARRERAWTRIAQAIMVATAFQLVFDSRLTFWSLGWRMYKPSNAVGWVGVALTAAGLAFAFWARVTLGRNWSGNVTVKEHHELVVSGPYRIVRHPIYAGLTLGMVGTALVVGELRGLVAVALVVVAWRLKWPIEERFMLEEFGERYAEYRRRVSAIIPGIW